MKHILLFIFMFSLAAISCRADGVMPDTVLSVGTGLSEEDIEKLKSDANQATYGAKQVVSNLNRQRFYCKEHYAVVSCPGFKETRILNSRYLVAKVEVAVVKDWAGAPMEELPASASAQHCVMGLLFDVDEMFGWWVPEKNFDEIIRSRTLAAVGEWQGFRLPVKHYTFTLEPKVR